MSYAVWIRNSSQPEMKRAALKKTFEDARKVAQAQAELIGDTAWDKVTPAQVYSNKATGQFVAVLIACERFSVWVAIFPEDTINLDIIKTIEADAFLLEVASKAASGG